MCIYINTEYWLEHSFKAIDKENVIVITTIHHANRRNNPYCGAITQSLNQWTQIQGLFSPCVCSYELDSSALTVTTLFRKDVVTTAWLYKSKIPKGLAVVLTGNKFSKELSSFNLEKLTKPKTKWPKILQCN